LEGCKKAVDEYRDTHNISAAIQIADDENGVIFWQK
jgi:O-methyltransferase/8-demethyl-8-(2,3-dimethoxy-alpha-L-rhamnosyl)tetracenomycin-C 4'-O-methyltransferase